MENDYYRALISATCEEEAKTILETLLEKHLVAGGLISEGFSHHWWQGKIDREKYYNISSFTLLKNKDQIIRVVEELSADDTPVVAFFKIEEASEKTLKWIDENCL